MKCPIKRSILDHGSHWMRKFEHRMYSQTHQPTTPQNHHLIGLKLWSRQDSSTLIKTNRMPTYYILFHGNTIGFYAHDEPLLSILVCTVLVFKLSSTWKIHQSQHPLILPQSLMKFALYLENFSGVIFHGTRQGHHWCLLLNQEDLGLLLEPSPALQRTQTQNFNSSDTSNEQKRTKMANEEYPKAINS